MKKFVVLIIAFTLMSFTSVKADTLDTCYKQNPKDVRQYIESEGWTIRTEDLKKTYGMPYLALTVLTDKEILLDIRPQAVNSVSHEIGHVADYYLGSPSLNPDFEYIRQIESVTMVKQFPTHENNYSTPVEYFAESYQNCIYSPKWMRENCPLTYYYVMSWIKEL